MVELEELRMKIQETDAKIIEILKHREQLSKEIGRIKFVQGKEIIDLGQEQKLFAYYENLSKHYNLPQSFVKSVFELIISNSRMVQKL